MTGLERLLEKVRPHFEKEGKLSLFFPLYDATETFLLTAPTVTRGGPHIRDSLDLKRVMITVVVSLAPCTLFGIYNAGYQSLRATGSEIDFFACFSLGAKLVIPIIAVSYAVGGAWEVLFAIVRRHPINEGFLVTGILFPLTLPPTLPLWMVAAGVSFGVVIGKEIFGGTGMNVLNPALTARAFVFFAYPAAISGDRVWIAHDPAAEVDGFSGATALVLPYLAEPGSSAVEALRSAGYHDFSWLNLFLGFIPGSIGETSTLCCLLGAAVLIVSGIGSWRTMAACVIGMVAMSGALNLVAMARPDASAFLTLPFWYHMVMGGFAFGAVFMATDPVSCATTNAGKWVYGVLIGVLATLIRTVNPAFPEGMMLAILFMNVFAPLIDHFVISANIRRRELRYAG